MMILLHYFAVHVAATIRTAAAVVVVVVDDVVGTTVGSVVRVVF